MTEKSTHLSDEEFLYAYLNDYLAGALGEENTKRFQSLLGDHECQQTVEKIRAAIGRFQLSFQGYYLTEDQKARLHEIVEDAEVRKTREMNKIEQVGKFEHFGDIRRRTLMILVAVGLLGWAVWYFSPEKQAHFDPLEALSYEALALEEDPDGRLDLPTANLDEIKDYVAAYRGVDYKPYVFDQQPPGWKPDGATIIDYEVAKIITVQFSNRNIDEKIFYFTFKGELSDLPKTDPGNLQGFIYHTYASDVLNMIVWQQQEGVLSMLVGHRSAPELAAIAKAGMGED